MNRDIPELSFRMKSATFYRIKLYTAVHTNNHGQQELAYICAPVLIE